MFISAALTREEAASRHVESQEPFTPPLFVERSEEQWAARLHSSLEYWQDGANQLTSAPDAALLIHELNAPSQFIIRQLPAAARDAIALCEDASISRGHLAERLGQDPSLVQAMLRVANSAAMNTSGAPVLGLAPALERLGVQTARSILFANCVDGLLSRPGHPYESMVQDIWSHMIRSGEIARSTARCFGVDAEETFSVALLHDVGKLIVFDQISTLRSRLRRPVNIPLSFLHCLLQDVHEATGAMAAFAWGMGMQAANAIGTHHRHDGTGAHYPLAEALYSAERLDNMKRRGERLNIERIWETGRLTGSPSTAGGVISAHFHLA